MHLVTLKLPDSMHSVHPVFHVSQLEPASVNPFPHRHQPPPLPVDIDGELEYEILEILDSKIDRCHTPKVFGDVSMESC
jgi:isopentenyl phosphate kinase